MFCTNCGSKTKEKDLFCKECGSPIKQAKNEVPTKNDDAIKSEKPIKTDNKTKKSQTNIISIILVSITVLLVLLFIFLAYSLISNKNNPLAKVESNDTIDVSNDNLIAENDDTSQDTSNEENISDEVKVNSNPASDKPGSDSIENDDNGQILPHSSSSYLDHSDIVNLDDWQLRVARNEIYARHGRIFQSEDLHNHFSSQSWYVPRIPADEFKESSLSQLEKHNVELIQSYK
ncbi:MAG: YARHG domain-containing protein [Epulopiscium sp.]|nr:YARHG domain-containing protein [Candidatus Epulonipiscium sp.]